MLAALRPTLRTLAVLALLLPPLAQARAFDFPGLATRLSAQVPDDWANPQAQAAGPDAVTVRFSQNDGQRVMLISVMTVPADSPMASPSAEEMVELVTGASQSAAAQSVEGRLAVIRIAEPGVVGAWFAATDRAPPPGEFRHIAQGMASVAPYLVNFTVLSHTQPEDAREDLLEVIRSLKVGRAD